MIAKYSTLKVKVMFVQISCHVLEMKVRTNDGPPVDIDVWNYVISAINSNLLEPKEFFPSKNVADTEMTHKRPSLQRIDIIREQESDQDILDLNSRIKNARDTKLEQKKYIAMDEIMYYLSWRRNFDSVVRAVTQRKSVLMKYHDGNSHMGVIQSFHAIKQKCFCPDLGKEINKLVNKCIPCQIRNLRKQQPYMQDCDFLPLSLL